MKRKVIDLIESKKLRSFVSVSPQHTVQYTLEILSKYKLSAIMVIQGQHLKGIFSYKDLAKALLQYNFSLSAPVEYYMTTKIYYALSHFTLEECLQIMTKAHVRHLPVIQGHQPISLISMRHIMEILVKDKDDQIRDLTNYITGGSSNSEILFQNKEASYLPVLNSTSN